MGIGSILGAIGSVAAAPFTGGTSLAWLPGVIGAGGALADTLGGAAKAGQTQNNTSDMLKLALANTGLNRDKFALEAPGTRLSTGSSAALKAALATAGPTKINWGGPGSGLRGEIPTTSGGVHDAIGNLKNNPDYMNLLKTVGSDELAAEKRGGASGGNADAAQPSILNGVGQSSGADKALGFGAFGSSILAALGKAGVLPGGGGSNMFGGSSSITGNYDPAQFGGIDPETGEPYNLSDMFGADSGGIG